MRNQLKPLIKVLGLKSIIALFFFIGFSFCYGQQQNLEDFGN
ncbi:hypothetical protein [Elizabethkingia sp. JS20170427COW]|nr:hypothetical protein [Elizabethkingia sp. JS20170427COW]